MKVTVINGDKELDLSFIAKIIADKIVEDRRNEMVENEKVEEEEPEMNNKILFKADEVLEVIKELDYNSQCAVVEIVRQVIDSQKYSVSEEDAE